MRSFAVILASPLYKYGISLNKLFDYLVMARPVILASSARNNPVAEAGAGLTVSPTDAGALAEAILNLSRMPQTELQHMGGRGVEAYVEANYSFEQLAAKLEKVFLNVLK